MGVVERRQREKQRRRNDIIDAAEKVFFTQKGYEHATMDDIARAAELSKGTLYLYFKDKEELLAAVNQRGMKILRSLLEKKAHTAQNGLECIGLLGEGYYHFSVQYADYFRTMQEKKIFIHNYDTESETVQACISEAMSILGLVATCIRTGIEDGSIRGDIDPRRAAVILYGELNGVLDTSFSDDSHILDFAGTTREKLVKNAFEMALVSLQNKSAIEKT